MNAFPRKCLIAGVAVALGASIATPVSAQTRWTYDHAETVVTATLHQIDGCLTKDLYIRSVDITAPVSNIYQGPYHYFEENFSISDSCRVDAAGHPTLHVYSVSGHDDNVTVSKQLTSAKASGTFSSMELLSSAYPVPLVNSAVWNKRGRAAAATTYPATSPRTRAVTTRVPAPATITVSAGGYTMTGTTLNATISQTVTSIG